MPTAYKTGYFQRSNRVSNLGEKKFTSKDEMSSCQSLAFEHFGSDGFADDTKAQRNDKEHEKGQRVSSSVHYCHCKESTFDYSFITAAGLTDKQEHSRGCVFTVRVQVAIVCWKVFQLQVEKELV